MAAVLFVFFIGGVALCARAYWQIGRHLQSLGWVAVPAQVLELRGDVGRNVPGRPATKSWRLVGKLGYRVNGRDYVTERLSFSYTRDHLLDDWWSVIWDGLSKPNAEVTVWIDPGNPADAVFARGIRWPEIGIFLGFGGLMTLVGYQLLFGGAMSPRAPPEFSWRVVAGMAVFGTLCAVLTPLLWRDGYPIWAVAASLPAVLALVGVVNGLRGAGSNAPRLTTGRGC